MNREEWLEERKSYIGGSDIGCIVGLSRYRSALDVYLEKTSSVVRDSVSEAAHWGNMLEDVVAREYASRTGSKISEAHGLIRHKEYPFIAANIDRWVDGKNYILECKTAGFMKAKEWGEQGTDQIPELYLCQVAYYAAICDVAKVAIAVLIGGQEFRIYNYVRNKEFESKLIQAAYFFWTNYIEKRVKPDASNLKDMATLYPRANGRQIKASSDIIGKIEQLKTLNSQSHDLSKQIESLQFDVKGFMQDNEILLGENDDVKATWRNGKPRACLDTKKLQAEHKAIYQQYLRESKPSRTFLIK